MKSQLEMLFVVVALIALLSGCTVPEGEGTTISIYTNNPEANSTLNPIVTSDHQFRLDGYLTSGGGDPDRNVYRDVSVRIYGNDSTLICVRTVGDWSGHDSKNVSVELDRIPVYVIVYSPDFWDEPMTVKYYQYDREEGDFDTRRAYEESELPVNVSSETGPEC